LVTVSRGIGFSQGLGGGGGTGEFDPGSERRLAAGLTHSSRTHRGVRPLVLGARVRRPGAPGALVGLAGGYCVEARRATREVARDQGAPGGKRFMGGGGARVGLGAWWRSGLPSR